MIRFLTYIDNGIGHVFQRIKRSVWVPAEHLACFRFFFGFSLLLFYLPSWSWLNDVPPAFYNPRILSFAYLTDGLLPPVLYSSVDILFIILLFCITVGVFTRTSFIMMFLISSIFYSYSYSFGKIDHHTTLLTFSYLCLAFTNLGSVLAYRKDKAVSSNTQNRSLGILGIIICFGLFTAGLPKFVNWIDFDMSTSGFLQWFYPGYFYTDNRRLLTPYIMELPVFVFEALDYLAAIFEVVGFLFLIWGRKYWIAYLILASFFHLANLLVLNIDFTLNVLCYALFFTGAVFFWYLQKRKSKIAAKRKIICWAILLVALYKIGLAFAGWHPLFLEGQGFKDVLNIFYATAIILSGLYYLKNRLFLFGDILGSSKEASNVAN